MLKDGVPWAANMILDDGVILQQWFMKNILKCEKFMVSQKKQPGVHRLKEMLRD